MEGQLNSWFFLVAILCLTKSNHVVHCYGNAGHQQLPLNQFGNNQYFPSVANLPLANSQVYRQVSGYQGHNIIRTVSPGVQNVYAAGPVPLANYQNGLGVQYGIQQAPLVNNNLATRLRPVSVPNVAWTPNRIPTATNVPLYRQPSIQPALTLYAGNQVPQTLNGPIMNPQLSQYSSGLYVRPSASNAIQQQLLNNQFAPSTQYAVQNNFRQPITVNQVGTPTNIVRNPTQQQFVNLQPTYPNQLSSPYGYQTRNALFLRNNNNAQVLNNPSLYNQAKLQQAQLLRLQNLQLQQQSLLTQQRLSRPVATTSQLSFRPSPQLSSGAVFDEPQSLTDSPFLPVRGANADVQQWTPLSEDEEIKATPVESVKSLSVTKKPKGKALTIKVEPEVKTATTKTSTKKATTTTAPKTKTTTTATEKPTSSTTTEAILAETSLSQANSVVETIESPQLSEFDSGTRAEASRGEAAEPLGIETAGDGLALSGSSNQTGGAAAEPDASVASEPLVLAVANPAFLDEVTETFSEKPSPAK